MPLNPRKQCSDDSRLAPYMPARVKNAMTRPFFDRSEYTIGNVCCLRMRGI